ncbi:DDT domain-containing protein PTM [Bienertia sinuspersici]
MEFVGKTVKKDFKGFGVFEGVVESFDSSTGFFKILYEDGDSEEADLSEVSRLVSSYSSLSVAHSIVENQKSGKKVGRKPKKRRRTDPGKSCDNLAVDNSQHNVVIENGIGHNAVNDLNASVNVNGVLDGIVGINGLDLNRGLNFDDGVENAEFRGCIDLNLTVNDDGLNEHDTRFEKVDSLPKIVRGFDLNLGANEESLSEVNGNVDINVCVGLGEEVKNGDNREAATPDQCEDGASGQRKKKKVRRNLRSSTETVLRRIEDDPNDLSMSGVTDEIEEKPVPPLLETPVEPQVSSSKIELPPSSATLNLEGIPVLDLFSVYSCLRSFSTILYLSPFKLEDFVAALKSRVSNQLIDLIHVSILLTLRKHLDLLARLKPGFTLSSLKLFDGEYYKQPAEVKIELLRCLCDDVIEVDAIRSELMKRKLIAEANTEAGRKRKISLEAPGDSCLSEDMKDEVADGNSDECCLCKMDGNLICCDGCPAAYHSKCVGIVSSLLPEGDWFCPECVIGRLNFVNKYKKSVRGAELLGTDPYGRLFFSCFDYLLVSDSHDAEALCSYYHKDDLGAVIQLLRSSSILYGSILSAISKRWAFLTDLCQPKSDMGSENYSAKPCIENYNLLTSSEGFGEVLQENGLIQKSGRPVSDIVARGSASKQKKKKTSARKGRPSLKAKEEDVIQGQSGDDYINCYNFALTASSVVEELLRKPSGKVSIDVPKTEEEIISIQLKFIMNKSSKSCWTTIQDLNRERQKEKCDWCYCCRFPVEGRGCLFSVKNSSPIPDALKVEFEGILSKKNKKGHLVDVICYIIFMEERLRGFLAGPWLRPQYSELWRKRVLKASDVLSLKQPLLMLESNLRPLALAADWWKHVDLVATMGSATHFVASLRATAKNAISRKKVKDANSKSKSSTAGLVFFWWRGGKTSRSLFNCKVIPHSLAMKVARKAGCMKIPDIQYPDASEFVRRTRCFAWRAAVESSTSVEQLALQVGMGHQESARMLQRLEGTVAKYLLDFGKRRSIPDVVLKHGKKFEDSDSERKKYWLDEEYVPLYLLKSFEERRISRKVGKSKTNACKLSKGGKVTNKPLREKGFDYLFSRAERADSYQCGHCNKNVPISDAVSCQLCNGYFHKRHVMKSSEGITARCTYTCHRCRAGKHVKKGSNLGKRKLSKLRDLKISKVDSEEHSAKLKAKPRKKRKTSANSKRQVLLRDAKKKPYHEQTLLQKNTDVSIGFNLRRSARKAKCTTVQSSKFAKGTVYSRKFAKGKKRNTDKLCKVESKAIPKSFSWKKKRTNVLHSFWINGFLLSMKSNDERAVQFKRRKLLVPSEFSTQTDDQPTCSLCLQRGCTSALMYIACDICGDWFHGDAFGLNKGNVECVIGFKCHKCRERRPPVCPIADVSRDNRTHSIESETCDAEELPDNVDQKETNHMQELQCNEGPPSLLQAHTAQNVVGPLDQDEATMLDSELMVENEPLICKEVASCSVESQNMNSESKVLKECDDNCILEGPSGLLKVNTTRNCDGTLDRDKTLMLVSESRVENESITCKEVASCSVESQDVNLEVKLLKESDDNSISQGPTGLLEAHSTHNRDGTLDQDNTPLLDSEFRVENEPLACKEVASCSFESQHVNLGAKLVKQSDGNNISEGPSGLLEAHTAIDQDETPMLDSELRVENESLTCKEVASCSVESQDVNLEVKVLKESDDNSVSQDSEFRVENEPLASKEVASCSFESRHVNLGAKLAKRSDGNTISEGPSGLLEAHTAIDQDETPMLDFELRVENQSLTCKEVASCSVESQDFNLEVKVLKESDHNSISEGPTGLLEAHKTQNCDGTLDQGETPMLDSEFRVENESLTCNEVASCSFEHRHVNLGAKLAKQSDGNNISEGPGLLEAHTAIDQDETPMLDSELRVENQSLTCNEVPSRPDLLKSPTSQNCNGTLDHDETLKLDSELRIETSHLPARRLHLVQLKVKM